MASTLSPSAYFLTCCRPIHNSFCFLIEKPKLINYYNYPLEYFLKHPLSECKYNHEGLIDHSLNIFNVCTDNRAWSLDERQRRQHFQDLVSRRIPHCGAGDATEKPPKPESKKEPIKEPTKEKEAKKEAPIVKVKPVEKPREEPKKIPQDKPEEKPELVDLSPAEDVVLTPDTSEEKVPSTEESERSVKSEESTESEPKDVVGLTEDLIEKLDRNLRNLEATFDKFVKKNRDFIQNLVECLDFEKQKQKALEDEYNKLKQENEELKAQNDYLKMVNNKQLGLFKNELDKGISESKVIYKRKIHLMERQLENDQNELQMYRQTEKKFMEVVEQDNEKIEEMKNRINDLKNKEVRLVKNYLKLLKFLENVKEILSNADPKEIPQLKSLNTITDYGSSDNDPDVGRVLRSALQDGISSLNVRDLSILHDAIEDLNDSLCHQTDKCTKSPTADPSFTDFSTMNIQRLIIERSYEEEAKSLEASYT